ncbi:MAG: NADH:flavin oxidoreductase/NADH oxidase family protein [Gammaproteobacteria bacterium]
MNSPLSQPLTLPCGVNLPNRIAKAAMTEGLADADDRATAAHQRLYRRWSAGGAGLLITGNVMVDRRFLERPGNVVIDGNGGREALQAWARAGTEAGNHLWMQISHPGRQASHFSSAPLLSPSDVQLRLGGMFSQPRAMSEAEIVDAIRRYAEVAQVARDCGFTGVQIHAAHGYLISQFLSPVTNRRSDQWGGELEHRARFLLEIVAAVRERVGAGFPLGVKLNSADFQHGGFTLDECTQVAAWLADADIDLLEISGGTYEQPRLLGVEGDKHTYSEPKAASTQRREAYFLEYAAAIQARSSLPLMVTGGFRSRRAMESAVGDGECAVIGLGRPLCVDPDLPAGLLDGSIDEAEAWERVLRLGPGRLLGPASPAFLLKAINVQGQMAWFYQQLLRLGAGEDADRRLGLLKALARHNLGERRLARGRHFGADV